MPGEKGMAIISVQKLENADKDAESLNKFVNGAETETVKTRLNAEYPTLANAVRQVMEAGGWEPFTTETALLASIPTVAKKAAKALDTKKVWYWNGAGWEDTGLSELDQAKNFSDLFESYKTTSGDLLDFIPKTVGTILHALDNGVVSSSANWTTTDFVNVSYNDIIQFNGASRSLVMSIAAYDQNKNFVASLFEQSGSTVVDNILKTIRIDNKSISYIRFCYYHNTVNTIPFLKFIRAKIAETRVNTSKISDEIFNKLNLLNTSNIIVGSYISKNIITANASWNCTDYIAVTELTNYVSNTSAVFDASTNDGLGVHFYDAAKNHIGIGVRQTYNSSFNTPKNCAFIRMNFYIAANLAELYLGSALDYTKVLTDAIDSAAVVDSVLNDDGTVTTGTGFTNWKTTDFIDVSSVTSLKYILPALSNVCSIVEYDVNHNFIKSAVKSSSSSLETLSGNCILSENTKFIRVCYYFPTGIYNVSSNKYITQNLTREVKGIGYNSFSVNSLVAQVWIALGDSITDHHTRPFTYTPIVAKQLNLNLIDGAYTGRRIRNAFIRDNLVNSASILKANIITIAHGTNDFKLETSLGTINDAPTVSSLFFDPAYTSTSNKTDGTFYADYKGVIDYIYSINPNVRIMLITPIRRTQPSGNNTDTNDKGHKLIDYVNAIKAVADLYALPCLDNYNTSGFSIQTIPTWTLDGLHPTEWAHRNIMAVKIANFIKSN